MTFTRKALAVVYPKIQIFPVLYYTMGTNYL